MVKHNSAYYKELDFQHFVVFTADGTVFGCAKKDGRVYNFLIRRENVQTQSGGRWRELEPELEGIIRSRVERSLHRVPTYKTAAAL